jgi:alternate signal-mediated exported protein
VLGAATASTTASWLDRDDRTAGTIVAGTLNLEPDGPTMWFDTSPNLAQSVAIEPSTFLATPGDVIRGGQYFVQTTQGDNLRSQMTVSSSGESDLPPGVSVTYGLSRDDGVPLAQDVPLGQSVTLPPGGAGDGRFLVDLRIEYANDRTENFTSEPSVADIGTVEVALTQVRPGAMEGGA